MGEFGAFLAIILVIIIVFFPSIWAKIVSGAILAIQIFTVVIVQNAVIDAGIDATVQTLEQTNIIHIPDSFCPGDFNRTDYCVEFGLEQGQLNGQVFMTGTVNEIVNLRFETKDKIFSCPLESGKMCQFAQIKDAGDLKISLTDKRGTSIITSEEIAEELEKASKVKRFANGAKFLNKFF